MAIVEGATALWFPHDLRREGRNALSYVVRLAGDASRTMRAATAARELTPSLAMMLATCDCTVRSEMKSSGGNFGIGLPIDQQARDLGLAGREERWRLRQPTSDDIRAGRSMSGSQLLDRQRTARCGLVRQHIRRQCLVRAARLSAARSASSASTAHARRSRSACRQRRAAVRPAWGSPNFRKTSAFTIRTPMMTC